MAVNSINSNIAAYFAQANIGVASTNISLSVARLSSGNRIIRASDDVAGLSIGTSLRTSVSTLRVAKLNAAIGTSLLQVADGALAQVSEILQRMKAIATQAGSGSLGSTERAYLDQEFQALAEEIDRIADSTNFNNVKLINGTLQGSVDLTDDRRDGDTTSDATAATIFSITTNPADGDEFTINGVRVVFETDNVGTTGAVGKVTIGSSSANTASNVAAFLNNLHDPRLANLTFESSGVTVSANWSGGVLAGSHTITLAEVTDTATWVVANGVIAAGGANGLGVDRTFALGTVSGSILVNGGSAATQAGKAIETGGHGTNVGIINNADFVGQLGEGKMGLITATYANTADNAVFSLKVGDITYTSGTENTSAATPVAVTFTGYDQFGAAKGGSFVLNLRGSAVVTYDSQAELDVEVAKINDALKDVSFYQNRDIKSFTPTGSVLSGGVEVANLTGFQADLTVDNFTGVNIEDIKITAPGLGETDAKFEVVINGETYVSISGIGNQIGLNKVIALQSQDNPLRQLSFTTGNTAIPAASTTALDIATQAKADALTAALKAGFGLTGASAKLTFQVGSTADDTLGVKIGSVETADLFDGASLNVLTAEAAQTASDALDDAIATVTSVRADVGAAQSRFNFASANLDSSIQNQDAARGELLDTDVASESTSFAISQVKLQAGISVLAQANQQLQSLLKLIG